jgi:hypothetical protein
MRKLCKIAAALGLLVVAPIQPALAEAIEEKNLLKGKVSIEEDLGYIYLTAPMRFGGTFVRVPDDEDIADYKEARAEAFGEALKRYEKEYKRWERNTATAKEQRAKGRRANKIKPEPIKPTESVFNFAAIEQFTATDFGPTYVFAKGGGTFSYLEAVKPGTYIWYGPVIFDKNQGHIGVCYCMGTVKFEVKAGTITDLGNFLRSAPQWLDDPTAPLASIQYSGGLNGFIIKPPSQSGKVVYGLPPSLAEYPSEKAQFFAHGKMNNFYGIMISRVAPIPGVLAYDRDRIIDLKAEAVGRVEIVGEADSVASDGAAQQASGVVETIEAPATPNPATPNPTEPNPVASDPATR